MDEEDKIIIEDNNKEIIINNINKFKIQFSDNKLYLTPLSKYLTEDEINRYDLKKSEILEAKLNDEIIKSPSYYKIVKIIWKNTPINKLLQHTIFNFKLNIDSIKEDDSYIWNEEINLAFQVKNFNYVMKEIINMCKINDFKIELKINLKNRIIILFKI
jgi:hypothetical protein